MSDGNGYLEAAVRVGDYLAIRAQHVAGGNVGDEIGTVSSMGPDNELLRGTLLASDLHTLLRHGSYRGNPAPLAADLRAAAERVELLPLAALLQRLADWIEDASMVDLVECCWMVEAAALTRVLLPPAERAG